MAVISDDIEKVLLSKLEEGVETFLARFDMLSEEDRREMMKDAVGSDIDEDDDDDDDGVAQLRIEKRPEVAIGSCAAVGDEDDDNETIDADDGISPSARTSVLASIFSSAPRDSEHAERMSLVRFDNFLDDDDDSQEDKDQNQQTKFIVETSAAGREPRRSTLCSNEDEDSDGRHRDDELPVLPEAAAEATVVPALGHDFREIVDTCDDGVATFALDPAFDYDAVAAGISRRFLPGSRLTFS